MASDIYVIGQRQHQAQRRRWPLVLAFIIFISLLLGGYLWVKSHIKPEVTIQQSKAVTTKIEASTAKTKKYTETNFTIDLPDTWKQLPKPQTSYNIYSWQSTDKRGQLSDQVIEVYEDTIPANYAVNRALIVSGQTDRVGVEGTVSDNCNQYTKGSVAPNQYGAPARWQSIDFLCDQHNLQRDRVGASSKDGVNTVILKSPSSGVTHKYFFAYTDYALSPNYDAFYAAITSFRMQ